MRAASGSSAASRSSAAQVEAFPAPAGDERCTVPHQPVAAERRLHHHERGPVAHGDARGSGSGALPLDPAVEVVVQGGGLAEGAQQMRCRRPLRGRVGAVKQQQAEWTEQLGQSSGVGGGDGSLGAVVALEPSHCGVAELGDGKVGGQLFQCRTDALAQVLLVHRREWRFGWAGRKAGGRHGPVGREPRRRARLGEIVIVTGEPENRHDGPLPAPLEQTREGHGAERLVNGIERSGEQARLLPGRHREGAGAPEPGELLVPGGRGDECLGQRVVQGRRPWRGRLERVLERRGSEAQAHAACPSRIVRGESGPGVEAS